MGNPIYESKTPEKQFERIKLGRREGATRNLLAPPTYATVAATLRTSSRNTGGSSGLRQETPMSFQSSAVPVVVRNQNQHPLRALLEQEQSAQNNIPVQQVSHPRHRPADSASDLEEIIMRQLRPRTFSMLLHHAADQPPSRQDFTMNPQEYQTMESVMMRLRRQLRNSQNTQDTSLTHRGMNVATSENNGASQVEGRGMNREEGRGMNMASQEDGPRDQLERARRARAGTTQGNLTILERARAGSLFSTEPLPFLTSSAFDEESFTSSDMSLAEEDMFDRFFASRAAALRRRQGDASSSHDMSAIPTARRRLAASREALDRRLEALINATTTTTTSAAAAAAREQPTVTSEDVD